VSKSKHPAEARVAELEAALREIVGCIPLRGDGSPDLYDGTGNTVVLAIARAALGEDT
jgi:hypothetical protein